MINNRQNGRRRGRGGGQRPLGNAPNQGNRQENRNRGNAAQLHEKYKALARDAQLAGDRVQTEYYLQFADHYYRVLNENRARFEEQRRHRDDYLADEDEDQDEAMLAEGDEGQDGEGEEQAEERAPRADREARNGERRPRRERFRRERSEEPREAGEAEERIALEALPPAIALDAAEAPAKAPRRRTRRPRAEDEAEIAPAA